MAADKLENSNSFSTTENSALFQGELINAGQSTVPKLAQDNAATMSSQVDRLTQEGIIPRLDLSGFGKESSTNMAHLGMLKNLHEFLGSGGARELPGSGAKGASPEACSAAGFGQAGGEGAPFTHGGGGGEGNPYAHAGAGGEGAPSAPGGAGGYFRGKGDRSLSGHSHQSAHPTRFKDGGAGGGDAGQTGPESGGTTIDITVNHGTVILNENSVQDGSLIRMGGN